MCLSVYLSPNNSTVPEEDDSPVRNGDVVELVHFSTDKLLNRCIPDRIPDRNSVDTNQQERCLH